ncbi:MAG: nitroreductase family protein [Cytophagales bacterium]
MKTLELLKWRYATKKYNGQVVPQEKIDKILEAAKLAPSSSGLQAYKIFVISNKELKEKLQPACMNQAQIVEASHVLVFASWDKYTEERLTETFRKAEAGRGLPPMKMEDYKNILVNMYTPLDEAWQAQHLARQTYISASMAMVAAAELEVDTTPMEGFLNAEVDKILELEKYGLKSQLIVTLGYRDAAADWNASLPKFRRANEELFVEIK